MSDLEAIRSELARPVSRETVDKLVETLRRIRDRRDETIGGPSDDYVRGMAAAYLWVSSLASAALSAYESETKR